MEEIEKRIEKFFKFVDFECGLPSIITEKSFQNSEVFSLGTYFWTEGSNINKIII